MSEWVGSVLLPNGPDLKQWVLLALQLTILKRGGAIIYITFAVAIERRRVVPFVHTRSLAQSLAIIPATATILVLAAIDESQLSAVARGAAGPLTFLPLSSTATQVPEAPTYMPVQACESLFDDPLRPCATREARGAARSQRRV